LDIIGHFCVTMCYQNRQNVLPLSQFLSLKNFSIMKKNIVTVIYDRKNSSNRRGKGKIEARIYLSRTERKYITLGEATPEEWEAYEREDKFADIRKHYEEILGAMEILGKEMTISSFNVCAGIEETVPQKKEKKVVNPSLNMSFIDYMEKTIAAEDIRSGTRKHKACVVDAVRRFGKIKKLSDLTASNITAFDEWLHDGTRTDLTIYGYHKKMKFYTKKLRMAEMISADPYHKVAFKRGKSKEREPLTEKELKKMRDAKLSGKMERVRDLFIFAAYTGLAFCDTQLFHFEEMTDKVDNMYYIDGKRMKTGSKFFTPILQPAMDVLKKYNYQLPKISNQKANDYLHLIEEKLKINKNLTFHVARHSFATLALAHDVPIENVARMLGHQDIKTTQIYAKILRSTIERHSVSLSKSII